MFINKNQIYCSSCNQLMEEKGGTFNSQLSTHNYSCPNCNNRSMLCTPNKEIESLQIKILMGNEDKKRQETIDNLLKCFKNNFKILKYFIIENEYDGNTKERPWLLIQTEFGFIKIGWRHRVIEINWEHLPNIHKNFRISIQFKKILDVTEYNGGIHANDYEEANEFLSTLYKYIDSI